ncbi:hypothetical protein [Rhodoglobus vestalii]|nr:hypothetical protein [Rhodoglobus vestalii]
MDNAALFLFVGRFLFMGIEWIASAARHNIPQADTLYAITHAAGSTQIEGHAGETTIVYVGHPHAQTERYIEVIAAHRKPRSMVIFHAMEL